MFPSAIASFCLFMLVHFYLCIFELRHGFVGWRETAIIASIVAGGTLALSLAYVGYIWLCRRVGRPAWLLFLTSGILCPLLTGLIIWYTVVYRNFLTPGENLWHFITLLWFLVYTTGGQTLYYYWYLGWGYLRMGWTHQYPLQRAALLEPILKDRYTSIMTGVLCILIAIPTLVAIRGAVHPMAKLFLLSNLMALVMTARAWNRCRRTFDVIRDYFYAPSATIHDYVQRPNIFRMLGACYLCAWNWLWHLWDSYYMYFGEYLGLIGVIQWRSVWMVLAWTPQINWFQRHTPWLATLVQEHIIAPELVVHGSDGVQHRVLHPSGSQTPVSTSSSDAAKKATLKTLTLQTLLLPGVYWFSLLDGVHLCFLALTLLCPCIIIDFILTRGKNQEQALAWFAEKCSKYIIHGWEYVSVVTVLVGTIADHSLSYQEVMHGLWKQTPEEFVEMCPDRELVLQLEQEHELFSSKLN